MGVRVGKGRVSVCVLANDKRKEGRDVKKGWGLNKAQKGKRQTKGGPQLHCRRRKRTAGVAEEVKKVCCLTICPKERRKKGKEGWTNVRNTSV